MSKFEEAMGMLAAAERTECSILIGQKHVRILRDALIEAANSANLNDLVDAVHKNAVEHGWWEEERSIGDLISLCHAELSEALEAARDGHAVDDVRWECGSAFECLATDCKTCTHNKPEGVPVELVDCVIRIMDIFGRYKIDMQAVIEAKMKFNEIRPYKHEKAF